MDPLTATITIAGGIQTVFTFASALKTYIDSARSAREDLKRLVGTIESVFSSIQELQTLLEQNEVTGNWNDYGVVRARKCIEDGYFIVGKLGHVLLKSGAALDENVAENINANIFIPFVWPIYRSQVQELNTELILLKLDIGTAHTTYRSQTWTAEEKVKGTEILKKYQQTRGIFMSQLRALKEERNAIDEEKDDDESVSSIRKLGREEKRIFDEWEEAVAERLRLERRLKEEEVAAEKRREQQIRDDFVKQLEKDAADRQTELFIKRQEMGKLIEGQDIPPNDKARIIESAIQTFHPVTQDSELVQALIDRSDPPKAKLPSELKLGISGSANKPVQTTNTKRHIWSWRRLRGASDSPLSDSNVDIPVLLRDSAAPGGRAVLYAAHFTPDPYGQYRGIEVEALSLWAKFAKLSNTSDELTAEFMFLPENCKGAILTLLDELCSASKDYTWNMLLVYQARSKGRNKLFGTGGDVASGQSSAGIFAIFKRHLRQHHGLKSGAPQPREPDDTPLRSQTPSGVGENIPQEKSLVDGSNNNKTNNDLQQNVLQDQDDPIPESNLPATQRRVRRHTQTRQPQDDQDFKAAQDNSRAPAITLIEFDGEPTYRVPLRGMSRRDFVRFRSLRCIPDPDDPGYLLILANVPQQTIHEAIKQIYTQNSYGQGPEPKDFSQFQFVPSRNSVLNTRAALLQQRNKEEAIRMRMMSENHYDDDYHDDLSDRYPSAPLRNSSRWDRANTNIFDLDGYPRPPIIPRETYLDRGSPEAKAPGLYNQRNRHYDGPRDSYEVGREPIILRHAEPYREEREARGNPRHGYGEEIYYEREYDSGYRPHNSNVQFYGDRDYRYPDIVPGDRTVYRARDQDPTAPTIHVYNDAFMDRNQFNDDRYRGRTVARASRAAKPFKHFDPSPPPMEEIIIRQRERTHYPRSRSRSITRRYDRGEYYSNDVLRRRASSRSREREERRRAEEELRKLKEARDHEEHRQAMEKYEKSKRAEEEMKRKMVEEEEKYKRAREEEKRKKAEEEKRKAAEEQKRRVVGFAPDRRATGPTRRGTRDHPFRERREYWEVESAGAEGYFAEQIQDDEDDLSRNANDTETADPEAGPQSPEATDILIEQWTSKSSRSMRNSGKETRRANADRPTPPTQTPKANGPYRELQSRQPRSGPAAERYRPRVASEGSDTVAGADGAVGATRSSSYATSSDNKDEQTNGDVAIQQANARLSFLQGRMQRAIEAGDHAAATDLLLFAIPEAEARLQELKVAGQDVITVVEDVDDSDA